MKSAKLDGGISMAAIYWSLVVILDIGLHTTGSVAEVYIALGGSV
jgi:hypothetical protein